MTSFFFHFLSFNASPVPVLINGFLNSKKKMTELSSCTSSGVPVLFSYAQDCALPAHPALTSSCSYSQHTQVISPSVSTPTPETQPCNIGLVPCPQSSLACPSACQLSLLIALLHPPAVIFKFCWPCWCLLATYIIPSCQSSIFRYQLIFSYCLQLHLLPKNLTHLDRYMFLLVLGLSMAESS